jgi:hypothetical protein
MPGQSRKGGGTMKLQDLFLPKIARSNPKVRIEAIKTEDNVELLEKVAEKDSDARVAIAARKRIKDLRERVEA